MAKKIIPGEESPVKDTTAKETETKIEATTDIPPYADLILKSFTGYENLYVDTSGGVFIPGTPASIRGQAILYKNPYYQSDKTL